MRSMTWREAIIYVLDNHPGEPMHCRDIADEILSQGLRTSSGATPDATVNAQITTSINRDGDESPFFRVSRGMFASRKHWDSGEHPRANVPAAVSLNEEQEDGIEENQYDVITSFGMFWQRDKVLWERSPKILGSAHIDSREVDFSGQFGIYLLYDGREVIYVGRVLSRPLGIRLYEHTQDRLSARWNRFSWFGLRPVTNQGALLELDDTSYLPNKLIPALEAILIEAVEPRQNRKRGDDLGLVEFIQKEDPAIEEARKRELMDELIIGLRSTSS